MTTNTRAGEVMQTQNCLNCGKFTTPESGYTDFDWSYSYPTFGSYCNEHCAEAKRAKTDPTIIVQVERDNGCYDERVKA